MAGAFDTMRGVLDSLPVAGPDGAGPVLAAVEAAKRYMYDELAKRGASRPYQGPAGPAPTADEMPELFDGLWGWALHHAPACDPGPLLMFRDADLRRLSPHGRSMTSGINFSSPPAPGEWERAARRADATLNKLRELASWGGKGRGDQGDGPAVVDLDRMAAFLHLPKPSAGNHRQPVLDLLARIADLSREQENQRIGEGGAGGGNRGAGAACLPEPLRWLTVVQAASVCAANPGVISRAVNEGKMLSNGEKGAARRICTVDFVRWALLRANRREPQESDAQAARKWRKSAET